MNILVENGHITEMTCGTNFAYILENGTGILSTEYKVLQSQLSTSFVKCMKMLYNGKPELFYMTGNSKPLSMMLAALTPDNFIGLTASIFENIISVKNNGFLSCRNIDISFDKIYVDSTTYKVSLVYLPVTENVYEDEQLFESELRTSLIKLIMGLPQLAAEKTTTLASDLQNGALTIEDIFNKLGGKAAVPEAPQGGTGGLTGGLTGALKVCRIIGLDTPEKVELIVNKPEYIIGKKQSEVDGLLGFNKMISRIHCKVTKGQNTYFITDLRSVNGTYVNHKRLDPDSPCEIKDGDRLRLANSNFKIVISD